MRTDPSPQHISVNKHVAKKYSVIRAYKAEHGCKNCPDLYDPIILTLHHRDPTTKNPKLKRLKNNGWHRLTWPELYEELPKCDVLCGNCHLRQSFLERNGVGDY